MKAQNVTLYYRRGSSDKVYQAAIEERGGGFVVNFAYGRRGAALKTGTKTPAPVPIEQAGRVYDKLVNSKMAKGYTPGEDGTPYAHTDKADLDSGVHCQLLNAIHEAEANVLLADPRWAMQEKHDGRRLLVKKAGGEVTGINRKGLVVGLSKAIEEAALALPGSFVMDGEAVGDVLFAFDLLARDGENLRGLGYDGRLGELHDLLNDDLDALLNGTRGTGAIRPVQTWLGVPEKKAAFKRLKKDRREGVVFKLRAAPHSPGRPASGGAQLKFKFYSTASCIVAKGREGKRSVALELLDGSRRVAVGNVTIPANHAVPRAGAVVEVRYLYAHRESGRLYQPVYLGERDDVGKDECVVGQIKYKEKDYAHI